MEHIIEKLFSLSGKGAIVTGAAGQLGGEYIRALLGAGVSVAAFDLNLENPKGRLKKFLQENRNSSVYLWILKRFLEYGRVIDTIRFFKIAEIAAALPRINLTPYAQKKWRRMIEVLGFRL